MKCKLPNCQKKWKKKMSEIIVKKTRFRESGIFYSCSNPKCNYEVWVPDKKEIIND